MKVKMVTMARKKQSEFSYSVHFEESPDGGFVALVPSLPGCHSQGETLEETEQDIKEGIALYLESLAAHREPIPVEGRSLQGRVTVPISVAA